MALEAVVFPQELFGYNAKDQYNLLGGNWNYEFGPENEDEDNSCFDFLENQTGNYLHGEWNSSSPPPSMVVPPNFSNLHLHPNSSLTDMTDGPSPDDPQSLDMSSTVAGGRPKRRRSKSRKNKEEIENQRMTHIAVERNRRKQMNEYLSVLRSLMPDSYVQRGDQASIIGGAINYVKELEHRLQYMGAHKETTEKSETFAEFFTFPQYRSTRGDHSVGMTSETVVSQESEYGIADIEVTMVESHASLKIRCQKRPKQLLKLAAGLQSLRLTILHLNVTTLHQIVLYSLSLKVEDDCQLSSVDDIATAVYELLGRIQEGAA